jgi:hypothetical protein
MPQSLVYAAVGVAAFAAWRLVRRQMDRVGATLSEIRVSADPEIGARLVRGADGIYRPERRG